MDRRMEATLKDYNNFCEYQRRGEIYYIPVSNGKHTDVYSISDFFEELELLFSEINSDMLKTLECKIVEDSKEATIYKLPKFMDQFIRRIFFLIDKQKNKNSSEILIKKEEVLVIIPKISDI